MSNYMLAKSTLKSKDFTNELTSPTVQLIFSKSEGNSNNGKCEHYSS